MIPDVNVLVAAFRRDHESHSSATNWLRRARQESQAGHASITLIPVVLSGFLRIVTNSRVFADPDSIDDAVEFVDAILATPGASLRASEREWPLLRDKLLSKNLSGNQVTDAWIASAVETLSEHLVTFDRDFAHLLPGKDVTMLS